MDDARPNPDKLLGALTEERGGKLRIYFGYAAGVGKTYAMLSAARDLKRQGADIVVGYLEAHGRPETEGLLAGLEQIPPKTLEVGTAKFKEMDIDAVLKRAPQIVVVDEMAHTNVAGSRHPKRWEDIQELLDAGINVHTTVNVQHLESLNDIVAQITSVRVRETIPDALFDKANEVTLVDITPDELLKRFKAGKVYREAQAERAMGHYFKKSNLVALREIALRRTADRVHADVDRARLTANIQEVIPTREKLACLVDSGEAAALRATARMATLVQSEWIALAVESPARLAHLPGARRDYERCLELAEELGGRIVHRSGIFRFLEVLRAVRDENVTRLVLAKPRSYEVMRWLERLIFLFSGVDILWVGSSAPFAATPKPEEPPRKFNLRPYLETTFIVFGAFVLAAIMSTLRAPEANLTLVYLVAVIAAAVIHGEGASAWAAFLTAFLLSFGLTNFQLRLSWQNTQYLFNFGVSLLIGLLASQMTSRLKNQAEIARRDRELAESLYNFSNILSSSEGLHQIVVTAQTHLKKLWGREVVILLPDVEGAHRPLLRGSSPLENDSSVWAVADWAAEHQQPAGVTTHTLPNAKAIYLPLKAAEGVVGVLAIAKGPADTPRDRQHFERFTHALATKIEGAQIAEKAEKIYWQAERERLRGDLLSSVSEGLRMPLTILAATSATLAAEDGEMAPEARRDLVLLIRDESQRLERSVDNLTQLTRFELGSLPLTLQKLDLNEFVQSELHKPGILAHRIVFKPTAEPLEVEIDPMLFRQVILNILDNAAEYTPAEGKITVITAIADRAARLIIEDEGEGLPEEQLEKIFEKYYRLSSRSRGAGLGLTVCRAIVEAHRGKLWAENRSPRGLRLIIDLRLA